MKEKVHVTVSDCKEECNNNGHQQLTLEDVTPKLTKMWFRYPHLLKSNIYLFCAVFANITYGYDSSMMVNLQNLPVLKNILIIHMGIN